jgi:hypothetical protein
MQDRALQFRKPVSNLGRKMWKSLDSSGLQFQLTRPYENAMRILCICNDSLGTIVRPVGATWRPEERMRFTRVPEYTWRSVRVVRSAMSELKHSYQFHVFSIFECNESIWSSRGVGR